METKSTTSNGSDYAFIINKRQGSGGGSCYMDFGGNADGSISFGTNTSGAGTERMRITSGGDVQLVGNKYLYANPSTGSTTIGAGFQLDAVNNIMKLWTNNVERMRISSAGAIKFNAYDSTNQTGTPTYLVGTDASGNVVKNKYSSKFWRWSLLTAFSWFRFSFDR